MLVLAFDQRLASLDADTFIQQLLVDSLGVKHLVVGDDFRFGRDRQGDYGHLQRRGEQLGFAVERTATCLLDDQRVSSSRIRQALAASDLAQAEACLGRHVSFCGRVEKGHQRGRTIGFPTANVSLKRALSPVRGVFAVQVHGLADAPLPGVANIGNRPTVAGDERFLLEVHLFDFKQDIYGRKLVVELVHFIRDEQRFDSFDALRQQIEADALQARHFFNLPEPLASGLSK